MCSRFPTELSVCGGERGRGRGGGGGGGRGREIEGGGKEKRRREEGRWGGGGVEWREGKREGEGEVMEVEDTKTNAETIP